MNKEKILIIDDNSMIRNLFVMDFEDDFYVDVASCGTDGLETAATTCPDIILLDVNMPDMSGIEVIRQLELCSETKEIPVIVITASEYNEITRKQLRSCRNFKGFLDKFTPSDEIIETIKSVLKNSRP